LLPLFGLLLQAFTALITLVIESKPEVFIKHRWLAAAAALEEENRKMATLIKEFPIHIKKVHSQVKCLFAEHFIH